MRPVVEIIRIILARGYNLHRTNAARWADPVKEYSVKVTWARLMPRSCKHIWDCINAVAGRICAGRHRQPRDQSLPITG